MSSSYSPYRWERFLFKWGFHRTDSTHLGLAVDNNTWYKNGNLVVGFEKPPYKSMDINYSVNSVNRMRIFYKCRQVGEKDLNIVFPRDWRYAPKWSMRVKVKYPSEVKRLLKAVQVKEQLPLCLGIDWASSIVEDLLRED